MAETQHASSEDDPFEKQDVDDETFLRVLDETVKTMDGTDLPYAFIGGIPLAAYGRPRVTPDIDLFLREDDVEQAMSALESAGFATKRPDMRWLNKASKDGVLVDLIFRSEGDIYMDDELVERIERRDYKGREVPVVPPEDLLVMKAIAFQEETPDHWFDAAGLVVHVPLDWEYLLRRARFGPRKVLAVLLWAEGRDAAVPQDLIRRLFESIYGEA